MEGQAEKGMSHSTTGCPKHGKGRVSRAVRGRSRAQRVGGVA